MAKKIMKFEQFINEMLDKSDINRIEKKLKGLLKTFKNLKLVGFGQADYGHVKTDFLEFRVEGNMSDKNELKKLQVLISKEIPEAYDMEIGETISNTMVLTGSIK